ncbi:MAG: hypothetical protein K2X55_24010 [Burkholderiaceae bacterium]|nr:hypothetical protein [Burkholderiaceae bacterium]
MDLTKVTNLNVRQLDWAADERRAALAKIPAMRSQRKSAKIAGMAASGVWMSDLSGADRRSVKAWLAGRGDSRVALWRVRQIWGQLVGTVAPDAGDDKPRAAAAQIGVSAFAQMTAKVWTMLVPTAARGSGQS